MLRFGLVWFSSVGKIKTATKLNHVVD